MTYLSGLQRALQTVEKENGARVKHKTVTQNNVCWVTTHASIVAARRSVPLYMTHNTPDVTSHLLRRKEVLALGRASRFRHASEKRCYRSSTERVACGGTPKTKKVTPVKRIYRKDIAGFG